MANRAAAATKAAMRQPGPAGESRSLANMALMYRSSPEPAHNTGMRWPRFLLVLAFTAFTGTRLVGGSAAGRGADVARGHSRPPDRPGILATHRRPVRTGRHLSIGQRAVERNGVRTPAARSARPDQTGRSLHGRRSRTELHLHRRHAGADRVHHGHSTRESSPAPGLQGPVRAVSRSCGVSLAPVQQAEAGGAVENIIDHGTDDRLLGCGDRG